MDSVEDLTKEVRQMVLDTKNQEIIDKAETKVKRIEKNCAIGAIGEYECSNMILDTWLHALRDADINKFNTVAKIVG